MFSGKQGGVARRDFPGIRDREILAEIFCPVPVLGGVLIAMMDDGSTQLLRQFVETRSDEAFRLLVREHAPMVFSTALRRLSGNRAAAEDVTQEVFCLLARKASGLTGVVLAGWLYRQACRQAANYVRTETRRKRRETIAMEPSPHAQHIAPSDELARELDAAMESLSAKDRDALVIRYFESADYSTLGRALGMSEDAARKLVGRALEKLSVILKRRGITVASVSLGGTLSGFGAEALPESMLSRISTHAMKGAPVAGTTWAYLLKPIIAGVAATSLVSAVATAKRSGSQMKIGQETNHAESPRTKSIRKETAKPADDSLEAIISEIKRVYAGPANALTALRIDAALGRVENDRIPEFIQQANDKLSLQERAATYERLLERWLAADADAAMTFTLLQNVGKQVDASSGSNLLNNLFDDWLRKDIKAGGDWLIKHWQNPVLEGAAFMGSLKAHLARSVVDGMIGSEEKQALRDFLNALPTDADRRSAFDSITGDTPWGSLGRFTNVESGMDAYQFIRQLPDSPWKLETARKYLSTWMETDPQVFEKAAALAGDGERFFFALARLGARRVPGKQVPVLSGGYTVQSEPNDVVTREREAVQAGLASGLARGEVLNSIGSILIDRLPDEEALAWVDRHREEIQLDQRLAEKARKANGYGTSNGVLIEIIVIRWASRISDSELRLRMCRAAFRQLHSRSPGEAAEWLGKPEVPSDLRDSFQTILGEQRQ